MSGLLQTQDIQKKIEKFIRNKFSVSEKDENFSRSVDVFEEGYVDSMGLVELIGFLEKEFAVEINEEYLADERFVSIVGQSEILAELKARC